jgi:general secretion pathway protein K
MSTKHILRNEKGMALLITVMVVSLLVMATVQFGRNMRRELISSTNLKDTGAVEAITRSGVNFAQEMLVRKDRKNSFDSFYDAWGKLSSQDLSSLFERGTLHLVVADLSGRLQVNSLVSTGGEKAAPAGVTQETLKGAKGETAAAATAKVTREILKRLLLSENFGITEESQAVGIIDSLVDWIDKDDRESDFGAEDSYYRSLEHPYGCKNGPVSSMEELLLVKGITPDILYGTKEHKGLAQYLTVYGNDGKININTVDLVLLQAMDALMTPEMAKSIIEYREREENKEKLSSIHWYKEVANMPGDVTISDKVLTVKSSYFMITAVGGLNSLQQTRVAVVNRGQDGKPVLLYGKVD